MKFQDKFKFKLCTSIVCCVTVLLINLAIFTGIIIDSVVNRKISDQLIMTDSNFDVWGSVPGKYGISVIRNLTFFQIQNPDAIFTNEKLVVQHTDPIYLQEAHVTSSPVFSGGDNLVTFNQTYTFTPAMDINQFNSIMNQNITTINLYAMAVWDGAAKQLNLSQVSFYTLGGLLTSLVIDDDIYFEALSLGVYLVYVQNLNFQQMYSREFQPAAIPMDTASLIFNDPVYGFANNQTIKKWVQAMYRGTESDDAVFFADYYNLTYNQISLFFKGKFSKAVQEISVLVKDQYTCPTKGKLTCDPNFMAAIQVGRQEITMNPPPPAVPFPTLGMKNCSVTALPEFSYYYQEFFLKYISQDPVYQNISLDVATSAKLFTFDARGYVINTNTTLVHPVTMDNLIRSGQNFDQTQNINSFTGIKNQLHLKDEYTARVMYEWCKYLAANFSSYYLNDMTVATKTRWAQFSSSDNYVNLQTNLKPLLQVKVALSIAKQQYSNCPASVSASLGISPQSQSIQNFCSSGQWNETNLATLYVFCNRPTTTNYQANQTNYFGFTYFQMNLLCDKEDDTPASVGLILQMAEVRIGSFYSCPNGYCSSTTLALMQMTNSSVTLNPLPETGLASSKSVKAWMPTVFPIEFELKYVVDRYSLSSTFQYPNLTQALKTWYWDNFFAPQMLTVALANNYQGNYTFMQTRMGFNDPNVFEKYINYLTLNVFLGGITWTGRLGDMLLGLNPPVVNKVRTMPPLLGGDPSIQTYISMNENNTYLFQTRFTGQQNLSQVGTFYSTNGNRSVVMLSQYWDGSDTIRNGTVNPWGGDTYYQGGDGYFTPHSNQNTIQRGYINDLYRSFSSVYVSKVKKNLGLNCIRYVADEKDSYSSAQIPANSVYYQNKYTGLLNYTKPRRAPVFLSKMMFQDANASVANNVQIQNPQGQNLSYTGDEMGGYMDLEPKTGIPVSLAVNFQINVDCSNDTLLNTRDDFMVPFFQLRRTLDLSDSQVQDIFGAMLKAFTWSKVVTIVTSILSGLGVFFLVFLIIRNRELMSQQKETAAAADEEEGGYKKMKGVPAGEDESDFGMTVMKNNMASTKTDPNTQKLSTKSLMM